MAMQFTMVSGLAGDIIKRLKTFKQDTDEQLSDIKQDIGAFYVKFDRLDRHIIALDKKTDQRFTTQEEKFDNLEQRLAAQESKTDQRFTVIERKFEQRFTSLDGKFDSMLQMLAALTKKSTE